MLVEIPDMYYIVPGEMFMYIYVIGVGMILIRHDFRGMSEEEIKTLVHHVRRRL